MKQSNLLMLLLLFTSNSIIAQVPNSFKKSICTTILSDLTNQGALDSTNSRGVANNYLLWDNGSTILVKFMPGGSDILRNKVMKLANEWSKYANITFKFVSDDAPNTNIRIKLGTGKGHNSAVGTKSNSIPQHEQTINFDTLYLYDQRYYVKKLFAKHGNALKNFTEEEITRLYLNELREDPNHWDEQEFYGVVVHEFGHSLGLLHEQSYTGAINWNKSDSVYAYYEKTQGWDRATVDWNVFRVSEKFYTNGTYYDPKSIMHYSIEPWQTTNGYSLEASNTLSDGDKSLIAELYPKDKVESSRDVARIQVRNLNNFRIEYQPARKGYSIKPSFELTTNSKLGKVFCIVYVTDTEGNFIEAQSQDQYNAFGSLATYKLLHLKANSTFTYNKSGADLLEFFIPQETLRSIAGQNISMVFSIFQQDESSGKPIGMSYFLSKPSETMNVPTR